MVFWTVCFTHLLSALSVISQVNLPSLTGYNFISVPTLASNSGLNITITAINDSNQYVGNINNPGYAGGTLQGFFIDNNGNAFGIADPTAYPSPNFSGVYGITDTGKILGTVGYNSAGQGFLYDIPSGTYSTLPVPSGRPNFGAYGISSSGNHIVGRSHYSSGIDVAYELTGTSFTQLNIPGSFTYAYGVNNQGYVVGDYYPNGTAYYDSVGYVLSPSGQFTPINFPGAYGLTATGINDENTIIGNFSTTNGIGAGFLETSNGTFFQVQFPGAVGTALSAINNAGILTGSYSTTNGNTVGFVATPFPPMLSIGLVNSNAAVVSWSPPYVLTQSQTLTASDWTPNTDLVSVVNGTNQVTISPLTNLMFYRLSYP